MASSTETFGIPELLEMILECATLQDLLLWQRVNKAWQTTIQNSPRIQEKLFFRAKTCGKAYEETSALINPFMDLFFETESGVPLSLPLIATKQAFNGKLSYKTASWKQMFMTSPAVTQIGTLVHYYNARRRRRHYLDLQLISCERGVTIGHLADAQQNRISH